MCLNALATKVYPRHLFLRPWKFIADYVEFWSAAWMDPPQAAYKARWNESAWIRAFLTAYYTAERGVLILAGLLNTFAIFFLYPKLRQDRDERAKWVALTAIWSIILIHSVYISVFTPSYVFFRYRLIMHTSLFFLPPLMIVEGFRWIKEKRLLQAGIGEA